MSTELGQLFSDGLTYSAAIFDAKSIFVMPGSYIAAIPQTTEYAAAKALDSTGGLRKDEFYWRNAEHDALIPAHWAHRHQTGEAWNGGSHQEIILANLRELHVLLANPTPEQFFTSFSGTGLIARGGSGYTQLKTGNPSTINAWGLARKGGAELSFSNKIFWRTKCRVNDDLAQLVRFGCAMEDPANAADNLEKFGLEGCDGDGPNFRLVTANGIGRHKEPTPFAIEQASMRGYAMLCEPGTTVTIQYDDGTEVAESNNIPSTGNAGDTQAIKFGIKTTSTIEKVVNILSAECFGISGDEDWFQMSQTA